MEPPSDQTSGTVTATKSTVSAQTKILSVLQTIGIFGAAFGPQFIHSAHGVTLLNAAVNALSIELGMYQE